MHDVNKSFYKKALFQISFEDNHYLGTFTYDFLKYSYFTFIEDNKKKETNIENTKKTTIKSKKLSNSSLQSNELFIDEKKYNVNLTKYISFFMNFMLKDKNYDIYFISEICDNPENNSLLNIELDNRVHIQCVLDQKNMIFHFLDYHIENSEFQIIENQINTINNIWDFSDYSPEEIPFTENIFRNSEKRSVKKIFSKKKSSYSDLENESEYEESDEEEHNKFIEDCKKYEESNIYYSSEFRQKINLDAANKIIFLDDLAYKVKNIDEKLYEYFRLKKATQICRKFIFEDEDLFRLRHLFVVKEFYIKNEDNINTDFDNNDDLEVSIYFELESTCRQFKSSGEICKSGCYENGGFNTITDIDYPNNSDIDKRIIKELYLHLFEYYNPLDI